MVKLKLASAVVNNIIVRNEVTNDDSFLKMKKTDAKEERKQK